MDDIFEMIKNKLSLFENMYDTIRVVNPINKKIIFFNDKGKSYTDIPCFEFWEKNSFCKNCISLRAYSERDTFAKLEYVENKVFLILAAPMIVNNITYIIEISKELSKYGEVFDNKANYKYYLSILINKLNDNLSNVTSSIGTCSPEVKELSIENIISQIENNLYVTKLNESNIAYSEEASVSEELQISILYDKIEELRDSLNEICATSSEIDNDHLRLDISKYLDELIVDYTKKNMNFKH